MNGFYVSIFSIVIIHSNDSIKRFTGNKKKVYIVRLFSIRSNTLNDVIAFMLNIKLYSSEESMTTFPSGIIPRYNTSPVFVYDLDPSICKMLWIG